MQHENMNKRKRTEIAVLAALIVGALAVWYYGSRLPAQTNRVSRVTENYKPMRVENPRIHWDRLTDSQTTEYKPSPRDIFNRDLPPPPPKPVHVPAPGDNDYVAPVVPPPPPPPPPQLPLKYFGEATVQSGSGRRAFLTDGDAVQIVAEGDIVLGRYRIIRINHTSVEFEEIASGRHGTARIQDQGPAI
jgi:hypothetical protein